MTEPLRDLFLFGTLLDEDLRRCVAGRDTAGVPAWLPDRGIWRAAGGDYPVLGPGNSAAGLLLQGLDDRALARLHYYEEGFGYGVAQTTVMTGTGASPVLVYRPAAPEPPSDEAWSLNDWRDRWGAMTRTAAQEAMRYFGQIDGAALRQRMPTIRVRADSALRALRQPAPVRLRRAFGRGDVSVIEDRRPHVDFFALADIDLTHTRFDGTTSARMSRAGLISGDAVTVLPYDARRDRVLLVEQFRVGPYLRGDPHPWCIEPVAGRIDPGETPEQAARRETQEEAGLVLHRLLPVANTYPSPGPLTEYLFNFIGLCDLPDRIEGRGGLDAEHEDIRTHVITFDALMAAVDDGEAEDGPLVMSALWLERERARRGRGQGALA